MLNDQTSGARLLLLIITKLQQTAPAAYRKIANDARTHNNNNNKAFRVFDQS